MTKRKAEYIAPEEPQVQPPNCEIGTPAGVANYPDLHSEVDRTALEPEGYRALHGEDSSPVEAETVGPSETSPTSLHVTHADCTQTGHNRGVLLQTTTGSEDEYTSEQRETLEDIEAFWALLLDVGYEPC